MGNFSIGDSEGVRVGSFVRGEMVGEPSGKAGQNTGNAPPRSGPYHNKDVGNKAKVEQVNRFSIVKHIMCSYLQFLPIQSGYQPAQDCFLFHTHPFDKPKRTDS